MAYKDDILYKFQKEIVDNAKTNYLIAADVRHWQDDDGYTSLLET